MKGGLSHSDGPDGYDMCDAYEAQHLPTATLALCMLLPHGTPALRAGATTGKALHTPTNLGFRIHRQATGYGDLR